MNKHYDTIHLNSILVSSKRLKKVPHSWHTNNRILNGRFWFSNVGTSGWISKTWLNILVTKTRYLFDKPMLFFCLCRMLLIESHIQRRQIWWRWNLQLLPSCPPTWWRSSLASMTSLKASRRTAWRSVSIRLLERQSRGNLHWRYELTFLKLKLFTVSTAKQTNPHPYVIWIAVEIGMSPEL